MGRQGRSRAIDPQPDDDVPRDRPGPRRADACRWRARAARVVGVRNRSRPGRRAARDARRRTSRSSRATSSTSTLGRVDRAGADRHAGPRRRQPALQRRVADPVQAARRCTRPACRSRDATRDAAARGRRPADRGARAAATTACSASSFGTRRDVERLLTLPPGAFRPPPEGARRRVVRLRFHAAGSAGVETRAAFAGLVQAVFTRRRKTLANALLAFAPAVAGDAGARSLRDGRHRRRAGGPRRSTIAEFVRARRRAAPAICRAELCYSLRRYLATARRSCAHSYRPYDRSSRPVKFQARPAA